MASRRWPALALAALATLQCATASANFTATGYTANIYAGYYANGTTPLAQSFAAANSVLRGLPIRCALITLLQNSTWMPDNGACRAPLRQLADARAHERSGLFETPAREPDAPRVRSDVRRRLCVPHRLQQ